MSRKFGKIKNPKLKKAWLADLRSGNFRQTDGNLCIPGAKNIHARYCCLGVLGRTCQRTKLFNVVFRMNDGWRDLEYKNDLADDNLPENLRNEIGINEKGITALIHMNDAMGKNFNEIADWIEKNL